MPTEGWWQAYMTSVVCSKFGFARKCYIMSKYVTLCNYGKETNYVHFRFIILFWVTTRIVLHALLLKTQFSHIVFPPLSEKLCLSSCEKGCCFLGESSLKTQSGGLTVAVIFFNIYFQRQELQQHNSLRWQRHGELKLRSGAHQIIISIHLLGRAAVFCAEMWEWVG